MQHNEYYYWIKIVFQTAPWILCSLQLKGWFRMLCCIWFSEQRIFEYDEKEVVISYNFCCRLMHFFQRNYLQCILELRHPSGWSQWYVTNLTDSGYSVERLRCFCNATLFDRQQIAVHLESDSRFCSSVEKNCSTSEIKVNISSLATRIDSTGSKCEKNLEAENPENSITKRNPLFGMNFSKVHANPKSMNQRTAEYSPYVVGQNIFNGYCGCRDLGLFRICHRCRWFGPKIESRWSLFSHWVQQENKFKFISQTCTMSYSISSSDFLLLSRLELYGCIWFWLVQYLIKGGTPWSEKKQAFPYQVMLLVNPHLCMWQNRQTRHFKMLSRFSLFWKKRHFGLWWTTVHPWLEILR